MLPHSPFRGQGGGKKEQQLKYTTPHPPLGFGADKELINMQHSQLPEMFYGAKRDVFKNAKELRENMTEAEKQLWSRLNSSQLGVRFKRQHPIDIFIADFYCHQYKLVVEVDGEYHNDEEQLEYDEGRTAELERFGITVIRFTNDEVMANVDRVVVEIEKYLTDELPPTP